jgi:hypothetical protein
MIFFPSLQKYEISNFKLIYLKLIRERLHITSRFEGKNIILCAGGGFTEIARHFSIATALWEKNKLRHAIVNELCEGGGIAFCYRLCGWGGV